MAIGFDPSTAILALNDRDESFDEWKLKNAPEDTGEDYDLAGAFNANLHPAENGHFPDTFKKPNHPTFSNQSIYSTGDQSGGEWGKDEQGNDTFKPSSWMGSDPARQERLRSYFKEREPNATLIDPDPYVEPFDPSTAIPREEHIKNLVNDPTFDPARHKDLGVSKEDAFEVRQKKKDRTIVEKTKAFASGISGATFAEAAKGVAKFIGGLAVMTGEGVTQTVGPAVSAILKGLGYNALAKNVDNELRAEQREIALGASRGEESVKSLGRTAKELSGDISHWMSGGPRDNEKEKADFDEDIAAADREKQLQEGKFIEGSVVSKIAKAGSNIFGEGKDIESTIGAKRLEEEGARKENELVVEMLSAGMDPVNIAMMVSGVATGGATSIAGKAATALAKAGVSGRVAASVIRAGMATASGVAYIPKLIANTATSTLGAAASFPFKVIRAIPSRLGRIARVGDTGITAGMAIEAALHPAIALKAAGIAATAKFLGILGEGLSAAGRTGATALDQKILTGSTLGQRNLLLKGSRALGEGVNKFIKSSIDFDPVNLISSGGDPNKFANETIAAGMFGGTFAAKAHFRRSVQKGLNVRAHEALMVVDGERNYTDINPDIFAFHQGNLMRFDEGTQREIKKARHFANGMGTDIIVLSPEQADYINANRAKFNFDIPSEFKRSSAAHISSDGRILINTGTLGILDGKAGFFGGGMQNQAHLHEIGHAVLDTIGKSIETTHGQQVVKILDSALTKEEFEAAGLAYVKSLYKEVGPAQEAALRQLKDNPLIHKDEILSEISRSLLRGQDLASYGFSQESNRIITSKFGKTMHDIMRALGMGLTQMDFGAYDTKVDISGKMGPQFGQVWNQELAKAYNTLLHEYGQRATRKMRGTLTDADREFYQKLKKKSPVPPKDVAEEATPEATPEKIGHLTPKEISDAYKSDSTDPIGAVIDAHKAKSEADNKGGLTVEIHNEGDSAKEFRTVDGVLIKGDSFSEYILDQVLVGTERRPLTQEERDIITGLNTGGVNGFVYGHAGTVENLIIDATRRREQILNPAKARIDDSTLQQKEQKRALFVNAVFNEKTREITLQMLSVDKLNNNYKNLVESINIANERGANIVNPYASEAEVVADLKSYAENYKNNYLGDGAGVAKDANGVPLVPSGTPIPIPNERFDFINLLLANESAKSETPLGLARRRIAEANGIDLGADRESNPLRRQLNAALGPKWSSRTLESPHEILRPELISEINGDITSVGGLRNVGPEFNEAFDKGIPDENMVAGNYMPKDKDDVEYYFTVSTGRQGAINNLIKNGRFAEIPEIIKLVVINAFSDMKSIPINIEDISGLYKESQQLDPTKEPAVRVSFKYKTEEELNAIRKRFCDLGEIWDQDEIYELTHNDSSKLDIGDQTNTMERIVKSIEINIRNLTEKNILRIAEESGINGLTISNEKILIYDQANEGKEFDRKSDRFRELATEETGMAEEGDVGWVALRKFGRTTDVSKAVTGYQDRIVSDPNIQNPFKFRGDLIKRLMMLGRVPDAPKNGKRSYYEKDDLSPIQINRHKVLARELEEAPDFDPSALDGYDKLCDELVRQYKALTAKLSNKEFDPEGIRFEMDTYQRKDPITGEIISGDLYKSSKEAVNDLFRNKRLRILKTDADAFGPPNSEWGEHPLLRQSGEVDANGQPMTYNDLLRGVHDTIAHSMFSDQFGQIGEEGAWQVHIRTISDVDARRALTAETRSQNSFVNFGSGMQNPDGTILKKGDAGWLSPTERPFGPQKVFLPKLENCLTGDKKVDAPVLDAIAEREARYMPAPADVRERGTKQHLEFWDRFVENSGMKSKPRTLEALDEFIRNYAIDTYSTVSPDLFDPIKREKIRDYYKNLIKNATDEQADNMPEDQQRMRDWTDEKFDQHFTQDLVDKINTDRATELQESANYLLQEMKAGGYPVEVVATILHHQSAFRVDIEKNENKIFVTKVTKIDGTNERMPNNISEETASIIAAYIKDKVPSKEAFVKGISDTIEARIRERGDYTGWKKYDQSKEIADYEKLNADASGSGWCTGADKSTAKNHLSGGDFYIYFENGDPKIAIKTTNNKVDEVRGRGEKQSITTPELDTVAENFIKSGKGPSGGNDYLNFKQFKVDLRILEKTGIVPKSLYKYYDIDGTPLLFIDFGIYKASGEQERALKKVDLSKFNPFDDNGNLITSLINPSPEIVRELWNNPPQRIFGKFECKRATEFLIPTLREIGEFHYKDTKDPSNRRFSFDMAEIVGNVSANGADELHFPIATKIGYIETNRAWKITALKAIDVGMITADARIVEFPLAANVDGLNLDGVVDLNFPSLSHISIEGIYAPNAKSLNFPLLKDAGRGIYARQANSANFPLLSRVNGEIKLRRCVEINLPFLEYAKNIDAREAESVNLPSLKKTTVIDAQFCKYLNLPLLESVDQITSDMADLILNISKKINKQLSIDNYGYAYETRKVIHDPSITTIEQLKARVEGKDSYMPEDGSNLADEDFTLGGKGVSYMPIDKKTSKWIPSKGSLMEYEGEYQEIVKTLLKRFSAAGDPQSLRKLLKEYPEYLDGPLKHIMDTSVRLKEGKIEHKELAKAYIMTIVSQGAGAISLDALQDSLIRYNEKMDRENGQKINFKINPSEMFLHQRADGKMDARPEEIAAYWITTDEGKDALNKLDYYSKGLTSKGLAPVEGSTEPELMPAKYNPEDFAIMKLLREFYGDDRVASSGMMLGNIEKGEKSIRQSRPVWETVKGSKATKKDKYGDKIQAKDKLGNPEVAWSEKKIGEISLSNLNEALEKINSNKGNNPQGMINILLKFKGIDSAKAPFLGHFIGFGQRITLDAVEKNYEIGQTADSRDFGKIARERIARRKGRTREQISAEKIEADMLEAELKDAEEDIKLSLRKELEVLSKNKKIQGLARKFIENKINIIRAERLAKNPDDPIGKIEPEAFFHIMHHWIWDAAKGLETTHEGLYEAMDTKYMPFAGEGATGFAEAEKRGDVFVNPFDFMKRFEISDDKMKDKDAWQKLTDSTASSKITIGDLYDHEELFKSYPWLKDVRVIKKLNQKSLASAQEDNRINVSDHYLRQLFYDENPNENILAREYYLKKTMIHEIQHLIQFKEKFPKGAGTSQEFLLERLDDIEKSKIRQIDRAERKLDGNPYHDLNKLKTKKINKDLIILKEDLSKWQEYYFHKYFYENGKFTKQLSDQQLFDLYFSSIGEMEARMAEGRSEFSDDYRKQNPAIYKKQAHPFLNFHREFPYPQLDAIYDAKMAEANAQRLKVDRYMPLDEMADEKGIPSMIPMSAIGKTFTFIMADLMEAHTPAERAKLRLSGKIPSSGGMGYAINNYGTEVCWASMDSAVKRIVSQLRERGGVFKEFGSDDLFAYVMPYTMKTDALISNNEYAMQRINELKIWKQKNPSKAAALEKEIKEKSIEADIEIGKNFDIDNFDFSTSNDGESTFKDRAKLMDILASKDTVTKYGLPSGLRTAHEAIDPFFYGVAEATDKTEGLHNALLLKVNVTQTEKALVTQEYRNARIENEKIGSKETKNKLKEAIQELSNLNISEEDVASGNQRGSSASEYGVEEHPSYNSVILGTTVALLRSPVHNQVVQPEHIGRLREWNVKYNEESLRSYNEEMLKYDKKYPNWRQKYEADLKKVNDFNQPIKDKEKKEKAAIAAYDKRKKSGKLKVLKVKKDGTQIFETKPEITKKPELKEPPTTIWQKARLREIEAYKLRKANKTLKSKTIDGKKVDEPKPEKPLGIEWKALPFNLAGLLTNPVLETKDGSPALNQEMTEEVFNAINATQTPSALYEHKVRGEAYRSEQEALHGATNPDLPSWAIKRTEPSNAIREEAKKRIESRKSLKEELIRLKKIEATNKRLASKSSAP